MKQVTKQQEQTTTPQIARPERQHHIDELTQDPENRRKRTERGRAMIVESLKETGAARSVVIDEDGVILAGNGVIDAAPDAGISKLKIVDAAPDEIVAVRRRGLTPEQKRALAIYDNRTAELAEWDRDQIVQDMAAGLPMAPFFTEDELIAMTAEDMPAPVPVVGQTEPDAIPDERTTDIAIGDLFELGSHRLICGDTTDPATVARLVRPDLGVRLALLHADPPYGMGKEADGVANDNLYGPKLDVFQLRWWRAWSAVATDNASVYIWGNAPDLWRLWYLGGLSAEDLTLRNEIVWDKGQAFGMSSSVAHSFPVGTERCLFVMRGRQFLGDVNTADYWDGFEPLRLHLLAQRDLAGWTNKDVNEITDSWMAGHYFTKSQFTPIIEAKYNQLRDAAKGRAFTEPYRDLFLRLFGPDWRNLMTQMRSSRTYFDNTHDVMTDVWQFPRVHGEERFGHATPKPVDMVARALKSSCPPGAVLGVPFGGTCPEIIAAEQVGVSCRIAEIEPLYCQVIIDRWEAFTGRKAVKL